MDPYHNQPSLRGLREVRIPRYENGFGFTLRHFIVYPPDVIEDQVDYPNGESRVRKVTEPVDTIFVKSVREDGPAKRAGLRVGDRIVSVNGDRIVGRSYDQVVHLIQNSLHFVLLEVSPKQFDTLQLFYEEKAYRPETNQRPSANPRTRASQGLSQSQSLDFYHPIPPPRTAYPDGLLYANYNTLPHAAGTLNQRLFQRHYAQEEHMMSSAYPNQQPLFSHLPRPPPYKSTTNWSHLNPQQKLRQQPQAYYPFQSVDYKPDGGANLWGIREETKSSESVLGGSSGSSSTLNSNRFGSMECLSNNVQQPMTWKNSPGYRFSISTAPGDNPGSLETIRREPSNLQGPPGGFISPTNQNQNQEMIVTMTGGANEMPDYSERGTNDRSVVDRGGNSIGGYELQMVDRIRRSTEQKEEFLRRPNQPLQWAPLQSVTGVVGGPTPFPKEFYAQPQKFQKVPWPPENCVPTMSTPTQPQSSAMVSDELMTVSMRNHPTPSAKQLGLTRGQMEQLRTTYGGSLDETTSRRLESVSNKLQQQQSFPKSSHQVGMRSGEDGKTDFQVTAGRNRVTLVGSGKLHCDPPKGWKHPTISFDETEPHVQNNDVILRKRENNDPNSESDRLVRRVSYLKATSSPIDMDRKSTSPTTPTKSDSVEESHSMRKSAVVVPPTGRRMSIARFSAEFLPKGRIIRLKQFFEDRTQPSSLFLRFHSDSPSSEFRQFGSFPSDKSPDSTEVVREGQVHFKVRAGDAKKGGYYRSWRQGWAQIRRSGCLYLSKERITKETISGTETDVILCIGLKDGLSVDHAEDYTKRKNVIRLKTSTPGVGEVTVAQAVPVEILIQGEDPVETAKWIQTLQQQQDNNNSSIPSSTPSTGVRINPNEMSSPRSLLRTFLPQGQGQGTPAGPTSGNYLAVGTPQLLATSPKSKTWKGRVAKQWKKIHTNSNTSTTASPLHCQMSIPETGATIGGLLEYCPQSENSLVPKILEYCIDLVETKGLGVTGIYRIPGNSAAVSALSESLNKGNDINPETDSRWMDVHVISSLLKLFLRKLLDPLLTSARYDDFIKGAADPDPDKALEKLRSLVHGLPDINYETLRHLMLHLKKVADNSEKNRMDPKNLAIVFGPTVVRTAEENVEALVNDMPHQCKIIELLINNADEIFKENEDSPTPPEEERDHQPDRPLPLPNSSPPKIENDIRTSLIQAALRKKHGQGIQSQSSVTPPKNIYGLPPHPLDKDRSVDESGLIRSYAGLGEETEQRVRQFEMETRAHLYRDTRSPGLPSGIYGTTTKQPPETEKLKQEKIKIEAEWRRAKEDLENEDFYDQLADNPSTIMQHRVPYQSSTNQNLSNSSISSTNSAGTPCSAVPPYGTWPVRLGPVPFKSQFSSEMLPPKAPSQATVPAFPGLRKAPPLRKINSVEKLSLESEFDESTNTLNVMDGSTLKPIRTVEGSNVGTLHYDSRGFGSLDSLQNLPNGSKENLSSDGSDLVSSLSRTLDEKMEGLRTNYTPEGEILKGESKINGGKENGSGRWEKGFIHHKRRNSLAEKGRQGKIEDMDERSNGRDLKTPSNNNASNGHASHVNDTHDMASGKDISGAAKKSKDIQRRHSLSGTVDILRLVVQKKNHRHSDIHISTDTLATALTSNNILESHV